MLACAYCRANMVTSKVVAQLTYRLPNGAGNLFDLAVVVSSVADEIASAGGGSTGLQVESGKIHFFNRAILFYFIFTEVNFATKCLNITSKPQLCSNFQYKNMKEK